MGQKLSCDRNSNFRYEPIAQQLPQREIKDETTEAQKTDFDARIFPNIKDFVRRAAENPDIVYRICQNVKQNFLHIGLIEIKIVEKATCVDTIGSIYSTREYFFGKHEERYAALREHINKKIRDALDQYHIYYRHEKEDQIYSDVGPAFKAALLDHINSGREKTYAMIIEKISNFSTSLFIHMKGRKLTFTLCHPQNDQKYTLPLVQRFVLNKILNEFGGRVRVPKKIKVTDQIPRIQDNLQKPIPAQTLRHRVIKQP